MRAGRRALAFGANATATAFSGPGGWARAAGRGLGRAGLRELRLGREPQRQRQMGCIVAVIVVISSGIAVIGGAAKQASQAEEDAEAAAEMASLADGVLTPAMVPVVAEATGVPEEALYAYASAGAERGVDWAILAGIGMVECSHGTNTAAGCNPDLIDSASGQPQVNDAGARGPMQFLGGTWRAGSVDTDPDVSGPPVAEDSEGGGYATDGDGDGIADPWEWFDATHSTARYLVALGVEEDPACAAFGYNQGGGVVCDPSHDYPTKVMQYADEYRTAAGVLDLSGSQVVGTACPAGHRTGDPERWEADHLTDATRAMMEAVVDCFGRGAGGLGCYASRDDDKYEHPRGRACDFMVTGSERSRGDAMAAWLQANADDMNILYIIWYRRIWDPREGDVPFSEWRPYSGASDHTDHVHVSIELMPGDPSWADCPHEQCSGPQIGVPYP